MRGQPHIIRELLDKAKESSLLAVEIYNKPTTVFRSGAYVVLMIIAWSSLLQAILHKKRIKYYERKSSKRFEYVGGERKVWSVSKLVSAYFTDANDPVRKNIELFISIRDRLEHRNYPELDEEIYGECQAMLMNFEEVLEREFPKEASLKQNLMFALQFSKITTPQEQSVIKRTYSRDAARLFEFIRKYREGMSEDVWTGQKFSFRIFLIPKVSNNYHKGDVAVEFIKYDPTKPEEMAHLLKLGVLIKEKIIERETVVEREVPAREIYRLKPGNVALRVYKNTGRLFSVGLHTKAWRYYNIRPTGKSKIGCNPDYCCFDEAHRDYVYSEKWVEFLTAKMRDQKEYDALRAYRKEGGKSSES